MEIQYYVQKLKDRRFELAGRIHEAEDILSEEHSKDWDDQAIEREGEEVLEALSQQDASELSRIDAALARVKDGTYGKCVRCGAAISIGRLKILPATPTCKTCAQADADAFDNLPI